MKPYYDHAGITIYHGDCRDLVSSITGNAFFADPPYGVALTGRVTKHSRRDGSYTLFDDTPEYVMECAVPVVSSLDSRGIRGAVTPGVRCTFFYPMPRDIGTIWSPAGAGSSRWGFQCSTPVLYYGKDPYLATGKGRRPNGFTWNNATEENGHPCPKPLPVIKWIVSRVSLEGETIIDPFMGSGTTLRAAKDLGRKAIGIEIEERYCEIAAKRMSQEVMNFDARKA